MAIYTTLKENGYTPKTCEFIELEELMRAIYSDVFKMECEPHAATFKALSRKMNELTVKDIKGTLGGYEISELAKYLTSIDPRSKESKKIIRSLSAKKEFNPLYYMSEEQKEHKKKNLFGLAAVSSSIKKIDVK